MKCKGFLFDLDGTLVDSLPVVERSWINWAKRQGINPQQVLEFIHGKQAITSLRHFMPDADEARLQEEFDWLEALESRDTDGIAAMPGAAALIARLDALAIPWGIVTSGSVPVAYARCKAAGLPKPAVFITAEQVQRGKPEPDAYLLGAQRLGLAPGACAVVEDAPAGILAGLTAGCQVIAVNAPAETPKLDKVTLCLHSLAQIALTRVDDDVEITL
ncbi:sugar phosphatase [Edwardsiella piscicida]|uniref:HAD-superfamily hydrolase, subfamily IA, variant 3 n=3 Tax=Edwardsiella TaxID=635 RepID=A0A0H3DSA5_EDWTF|nr:sugar phosphatase [Edwardsiella piscicida]ACY85229.1 HAD-superfamily hydrolase, subfamily IA, variant 3 [Edwardsiella tarda EIB202]ADM42270.1 HAD-superfamily hydrolase, subfamily IA, variant 3 [Edwardsiella tarda FL6-60]AOP43590.1 sugar phosphatase [Edwardsiella piscicida]ARD19353.1 sugar phosphatase [Edwardsiella piscicida]EKS7766214.1 sugar phosphatase [Edwardsiella piscicida]